MTMEHYHHRGGTRRREISSVEFFVDGVLITYSTIPDDMRVTGLSFKHTLLIPLGDGEYDEEYDHAYQAIQALLNDALEDVAELEPYDPREEDERDSDDDDDD